MNFLDVEAAAGFSRLAIGDPLIFEYCGVDLISICGDKVVQAKSKTLKTTGRAIAAAIVTTAALPVVQILPSFAQTETTEAPLQIPAAALAEIREAPFSELFVLGDDQAYAIKDQDYNSAEPDIGFFSLWGDMPANDRLGVVVKYCFEDTSLANVSAELVEMQLMDGDTSLVTIDQVIDSRPAYLYEIRPARQSNLSSSFYYDPFYDPYYYAPFRLGFSYAPTTYIPGVECSTGLAFFDLAPVQSEIAALPEQTLRVRLLFSNGATEYWRLGGGTVSELKRLPTIEALP